MAGAMTDFHLRGVFNVLVLYDVAEEIGSTKSGLESDRRQRRLNQASSTQHPSTLSWSARL